MSVRKDRGCAFLHLCLRENDKELPLTTQFKTLSLIFSFPVLMSAVIGGQESLRVTRALSLIAHTTVLLG